MKKEYINPEIEITELEICQELLTGSNPQATFTPNPDDPDPLDPGSVEAPGFFGDDLDW